MPSSNPAFEITRDEIAFRASLLALSAAVEAACADKIPVRRSANPRVETQRRTNEPKGKRRA
jgi:hypothetical protein